MRSLPSSTLFGSRLTTYLLLAAQVQGGLCSTALNDANFKDACKMWCTTSTKAQAESTYGALKDWQVDAVTDMSEAFRACGTLTNELEDNSWKTAAVTDMKCRLLAARVADARAAVPALPDASSVGCVCARCGRACGSIVARCGRL